MEFRKMVTITLCTRQQKRHWCIDQSYGLCGRGRGWGDLGEWHWNRLNLCLKDSNPWTYIPVPGNTQLLLGSHRPPAQVSCCLCHRCQIGAFGLFQSGTQAAESWRTQGSSSSVLAQSGQAVGKKPISITVMHLPPPNSPSIPPWL